MSKPVKTFIFCIHAHQPVGNFGHVFEEAFEKCYRPFFEVLRRHPKFSLACHFSGSLLDWLEENKPDFVESLRPFGASGQVEFLGGAYYEPIYGLIPPNDLTGQIALMREKVGTLFGQTPGGAWLTERVWDPDLVRPLKKAGVEYTVLDDTHFEKAGMTLPVTGYYRARQGFETLDLFASQKALRYLVPFSAPKETLDYIHSLNSAPGQALVFADDCEKFGFWPGTYDWVFGQKWLHHFMTLVEKDPSIQVQTFSQFRKLHKAQATVNVPHASYSEMMQWSGGRFYNFFERYPESKYMKERMKHLSARLAKSEGRRTKDAGQRTNDEKSAVAARRALYRAQCNCSYWHGVFGGLYLHHLRASVYENLIRAERSLDTAANISFERFETGERWVLRETDIIAYFNARYGGALEELDFLPQHANLVCTLQRRPESYHSVALQNGKKSPAGTAMSLHEMLGSKEKGLAQAICYDPFRRLCFLDHFFENPVSLAQFDRCSYEDIGDFADASYRASRRDGTILFERRGLLKLGGTDRALKVQKSVSARDKAGLDVRYTFKNPSHAALRFVFASEFNFSIGVAPGTRGFDEKAMTRHVFQDSWRKLQIQLDSDAEGRLLATPVETVSESEGGLERTYQQLAILFQKEILLDPNESVSLRLGLSVCGASR